MEQSLCHGLVRKVKDKIKTSKHKIPRATCDPVIPVIEDISLAMVVGGISKDLESGPNSNCCLWF